MPPKNSALDALRSQALSYIGGEERVEVNQRHLIDKILARYSAEYVVYRELMQNSDDACSKGVEIVFETASPNSAETAPNLNAKITRVLFKNNGMDFRPEDWNRLKKIAEGNPDESKIGAFGVGFYSLFSICEEPFVSSGKECMAFYWKNDQLYAKRAPIPEQEQQQGSWTTFLLDLREPIDMVNMDEFGPFLARSLGFTGNLREITVYLDHHRLLNITKKMREPRPMTLPKTMHLTSPQKIFTLKSVDLQAVQMDATRLEVSRWTREVRTSVTTIFLRTASGHLDVKVSKQFANEMERTTKKYPPSQTAIQLIYLGHDEKEASTDNKTIFKDLLPFPDQGRIFIGFPTHQTTGFCSHVAGRFIPTVERESLDFVDKCLQVWNQELLSIAGLLSRTIYEDELSQIGNLYREIVLSHRKADEPEDEGTSKAREWLENRALHALQAFQFHPSTPSPQVGFFIDANFFKMSTAALSVLSSHGVKPLDQVRIPDAVMSAFLKELPTLPPAVYSGSQKFMDKLEKAGKVQKISFNDVLRELESRTLTEAQMVAMLRWWGDYSTRQAISDADYRAFFQTALVCSGSSVLPLATFKWFVNPKLTPIDMPLPSDVLPYDLTKTFTQPELHKMSRVWQELNLLEWAKHIVKQEEFETSPAFSEKALLVLSRGWAQLRDTTQSAIIGLLVNKKCIPTKYGMKVPNESYFKTVTLFPDLPVMVFTKQPLDKLLLAMGARQSVELQLVFDRLVNAGSWDHMQLVKYLASVRDTLSSTEIKRLKATSIFPQEDHTKDKSAQLKSDQTVDQTSAPTPLPVKRYAASTLYVPTEAHVALGLPVIEWKGRWKETTDEAKLLLELGLLRNPSLKDLLALAAPPNEKPIRAKALQYFFENFKTLYSNQYSPHFNVAFLPTTDGAFQAPMGCFSNPACSVMGFPVLHEELRIHATLLRIKENPAPDKLLERLIVSPPTTKAKAQEMFEYLQSVQGDFFHHHWSTLRTAKFIPLDDTGKSLVEPQTCYFFKKDSPYHPDLLTTIDFGRSASLFLKSCGVKEEPTPVELTQLVVRSPEDFLNRNGGVESYKSILRQIATHMHIIRTHKSLLDEMIRAPFLLGEKRINQDSDEESLSGETVADGKQDAGSEDDNAADDGLGQVVVHYKLARANEIYLVDDTVLQQIFTPFCAPMEEILESLYESLGSTWISRQVRESCKPQGKLERTHRSEALQGLIVERAPLLLNGHTPSRLNFTLDWLTSKLKVMQVPKIQLRREFIPTGVVKAEWTTACVVQDQSKAHYLLITNQGDMDYFDIADALAKLVLKKKKLNDSIWWSSLLSTSLQNLKRKGFQVDRILNAKKAEKARIEAAAKADAAAAAAAAAATSSNSGSGVPEEAMLPRQTTEHLKRLKEMFPDCDPKFLLDALSKETSDHVQRVAMKLLDFDYPRINKDSESQKAIASPLPVPGSFPTSKPSTPTVSTESSKSDPVSTLFPSLPSAGAGGSFGGGLFSRLRGIRDTVIGKPLPTTPNQDTSSTETSEVVRTETTTTRPTTGVSISNGMSPINQKQLEQSLKSAIANCRPNGRSDIRSEPTTTQVSESLTTSYCDSKPGQLLNFAGHAGELEFYIHKECDPEQIMTKENLKSLTRFVKLLMILAQDVFKLSPETMHIMYDKEGPTIAFNRGGSLFFNWRYYVTLGHDDDGGAAIKQVQGRSVTAREEGLIYWFFTIAHELAHNFVEAHDSRHEFYMSSFCEQYLPEFMNVVSSLKSKPLPPAPESNVE
ncbi:hypothetical protein B0O80DRAFT_113406 [Mortierella sp. GBAus27b]|nr:hypothetical protein BGX31_009239 [Mortierella sp. GBA43]KAI8351748.1 hypothetical protein B0O80DRAFT_113406 [Mortierella sp. GBAus27b]